MSNFEGPVLSYKIFRERSATCFVALMIDTKRNNSQNVLEKRISENEADKVTDRLRFSPRTVDYAVVATMSERENRFMELRACAIDLLFRVAENLGK